MIEITKQALAGAQAILVKTDNFSEFSNEYGQHLRMHGDRLTDGAIFIFNLNDGYSLVIRFIDNSFENFSIIHQSLDSDLLLHV